MKMLKKLSIFLFVFYLCRVTGPGSTQYLGANGTAVNTIQEAVYFGSVGEAYAKQKQLGNEWSIVDQGVTATGKIG